MVARLLAPSLVLALRAAFGVRYGILPSQSGFCCSSGPGMTAFSDRSSLQDKSVLVFGASSQIGFFLLPMLVERGARVVAVSRREQSAQSGVTWLRGDL